MKNPTLPLAVLLIAAIQLVTLPAQEAISTTDFEDGMNKWRGRGQVESESDGNKVCELKKSGNRKTEITLSLRLDPTKKYVISYRARAMPGSEGVVLRRSVRGTQGAGFSGSELNPDGQWVDQKFNAKASQEGRAEKRELAITFHEGSGVVQIDDIVVTEEDR